MLLNRSMRSIPVATCLLGCLLIGSRPVRGEIVAVTQVIDGNSFEANGDRNPFTVRLLGVELPNAPGIDRDRAAASAKAFLECLIERKAVDVTRSGRQYGEERVVHADVWLGERLVNQEVVERGFGQPAAVYSYARAEVFRSAHAKVVLEQRGVWEQDGPPPNPGCDPPAERAPVEPSSGFQEAEQPGATGEAERLARVRARAKRLESRFDRDRWTVFYTTPEGLFGYDAKLTEREGSNRYATWLRLDYVEAQTVGEDDYHYSLERFRLDCSKHVVQQVSTVKYNHQHDNTMKVVFSHTPTPSALTWEPIVPESFGEQMYGELCVALNKRFGRNIQK